MAGARAHLRIHGRVQGVFYRGETQDQARRLGLTGWVANRRDGTVEAVVEGERETVEKLIQWCRKGPPLARVTKIDIEWEEPTGEFTDFAVKYTF